MFFPRKLGRGFAYLQGAAIFANCAAFLGTMLLSWWSLKMTQSAVIFSSIVAIGSELISIPNHS